MNSFWYRYRKKSVFETFIHFTTTLGFLLYTYREETLIFNDGSTTPMKQTLVIDIAYEVAHQWTGNLVTLNWWSYSWLHGGFAALLKYYISDIVG